MVSFTNIALLSLAAVGSLAAPAVEKRTGLWKHKSQCMSKAEAQQVADNYAELIRNYSDELANEALSKDFTDYSEGVNTLINTCPQGKAAKAGAVPLLDPSFTNRADFEQGQSQQPAIHFTQLNIEHNCHSVTIRWSTDNTAPIPKPRPVVGLILLETERAPAGNKYPWIVHTVYSEFDSGAWLQNLEQWGICTATESASPTIILASGSVGPAPSTSGSAAASSYATGSAATASSYATASAAPASASSYAAGSSAAASSWTASSAAASSSAASSATGSSWAASSTASAYATGS